MKFYFSGYECYLFILLLLFKFVTKLFFFNVRLVSVIELLEFFLHFNSKHPPNICSSKECGAHGVQPLRVWPRP